MCAAAAAASGPKCKLIASQRRCVESRNESRSAASDATVAAFLFSSEFWPFNEVFRAG